MPVKIRGRTYLTVAERLQQIHTDHQQQISIQTELVSHERHLDMDRFREKLVKARLSADTIDQVFKEATGAEVVIKASVTVHGKDGQPDCRFSDFAHEKEDLKDLRAVNATSYVENASTSAIGRALAAAGYAGKEYASADELARALEDADGDLIKQIRTLREQLKEASETEAVLKGQITDLKQKAAQNPALTAANQQFSALAKVSDQEQRRTKLMELCQGLVGEALDSILDLITPNHEQLSGDEAMRLLLVCYLCSGKGEYRGGQYASSDVPS
jgi:hypothetical protein